MSEMIQIKTLKKVFVSDKNATTALDGIDLSIEKGEIFRDYRFKRRWKKYAGSLYKLPGKTYVRRGCL